MSDEEHADNLYRTPAADLTKEPEGGYDETRPLSPKGRFGRLRYLTYSMVMGVVTAILVTAIITMGKSLGGEAGKVVDIGGIVLMYAILLPVSFIFMIRRLHDFNRSGWYSLTILVPLVNAVTAFVLLLVPGTKGPNDYGPPPRPPGVGASIVGGIFVLIIVLGMIAAIALPAYQGYVKAEQAAKANRVEHQ